MEKVYDRSYPGGRRSSHSRGCGVSIALIDGMGKTLRTITTSALLLAAASAAHAQVRFSVHIGPPPPVPYYVVPARPGPVYEWIPGYWYPQYERYIWRSGYWVRPPYRGAHWITPYYNGGRYFAGRWDAGALYYDRRNLERRYFNRQFHNRQFNGRHFSGRYFHARHR